MADTYVSLSSIGFINLRGVENAIQYQDEMYLKAGTPLWGDITHRRDGIDYDPEADIFVPFHSVLKMTREIDKATVDKPVDNECVTESAEKTTVFDGTVARGDEVTTDTYVYLFLPNVQVDMLGDTLYVNVDGTDYVFTKESDDSWVLPNAVEGPVAIVIQDNELELSYVSSDPPASIHITITQDSDGGGQPGPK